jgi:hypothetical protein
MSNNHSHDLLFIAIVRNSTLKLRNGITLNFEHPSQLEVYLLIKYLE